MLIRWNIDGKIRKYLNGENMAKVVIYRLFWIITPPRNTVWSIFVIFAVKLR